MISLAIALQLALSPELDDFEAAVAALRDGVQAAAPIRRARQARAARVLDATGSTPVAGHDDPARTWRRGTGNSYRQRVLGPAYFSVAIGPAGALKLGQSFYGGQRARVVAFAADKSSALILSVRQDGAGAPCAASGGTWRCDWIPLYTGRVEIELINRGRKATNFVIVMQ